MFKIRKISDARSPGNQAAIRDAQRIMREQFPDMDEEDIAKLPQQIEDPLTYRFVSELFIAHDEADRQSAFALLLIAPDLAFAYLDTISAAPGQTGGGIGQLQRHTLRSGRVLQQDPVFLLRGTGFATR